MPKAANGWWRSAAVMAGGVCIIGTVLFMMRDGSGDVGTELPPGRVVFNPGLGVATYSAPGLAVLLVLSAAFELRVSIARRRDRKEFAGEPMSGPKIAESADPAVGG